MRVDGLIDHFVQVLNSGSLEPLDETEVPIDLRTASTSVVGWYEWKISPASSNTWVAELEENLLPNIFPLLYRSLISRYRFARFEVGPIMFFANTGLHGFYELADRIFADKYMSPVLLEQGLLQFGTPSTSDYDPICFATRRMHNGEVPIVQIDHEDILSHNRKGRVVREIAPSFNNFVERVIAGEFKAGPPPG